MSPMGQILLFAISAFCLIPAASGLTCAHCVAIQPGGPCKFRKCTAGEGMICIAIATFKDDMLVEKALSCAVAEDVRCGTHLDLKTDLLHETKCCDTDFCNADYEDRGGIPTQVPKTLLCAHCIAIQPRGFCHFKECKAPERGMCIATIIRQGEIVLEKMLSCAERKNAQCGVRDGPVEGQVYDTRCCNHFNYCNAEY